MTISIAEHLSELFTRLVYLEELEQAHGANYWRGREIAALAWTIEQLRERHGDKFAEAEEFAERRRETRLKRARRTG